MSSQDLSRRAALRLLCGTGTLLTTTAYLSSKAYAAPKDGVDSTQSALDDAEAEYKKVKEQLDQIGKEYQTVAKEQSDTLDKIEKTSTEIDKLQEQIDDTKKQIKKTQDELNEKKDYLADRVSQVYKSGQNNLLALLLSSSTIEELVSNIYYLDKVSEADAEMIEEVYQTKTLLDKQKKELEGTQSSLKEEKAALDSLRKEQEGQLSELQAQQDKVQETLNGLSSKVQELVAKRDAELVAYNNARAQERAAAASAGSAPSVSSGRSESSLQPPTGGSAQTNISTQSQQAVVSAAYSVGSPGANLCAKWVSLVFQRAGIGYIGGNACDMYSSYCSSSNLNNLKPGMIIAVSSHARGGSAGRIYGHVGIYVGNNTVRENIGYVKDTSLSSWLSYYGTVVTPRWGWARGIALS